MFTIDGVTWPYRCSVERAAEVKSSEISGFLLNGNYFNDVIGTYMQYSIKLAIPITDIDRGNALYEILTEPVDGHTFVFPYGGSTVQITGRLDGAPEDVYRMVGNKPYWAGLSFTVTANNPSKSMSLGQVIQRGMTPLPDVTSPEVGTVYTWTGTGWSASGLPDGDAMSF
jgi:hypothetical protein